MGSPALGVDDALVPGGNRAPDDAQAGGHPALTSNQTPDDSTAANPPFSSNDPGVSTGAKGSEFSDAPRDA